jgi:pyridoxamine 5'-phosphate oxidase
VVDPIAEFESLLARAKASEPSDATACSLATATRDGVPSVRIVLLKGVDAGGFTFFTNYESRKAAELDQNPRAALCFYWPSIGAQVRVSGTTARVTPPESAAYFATRPRESQLGAWASRQSAPLASRDELLGRFREIEARYAGASVPCPPGWGGYRLTPERIELWWSREFRLHDRLVYARQGSLWTEQRLYP